MRGIAGLGLLSWLLSNAAAALTPQDFAYGMPIMATEVAAAYRVQLPVDVYKVSARDDLGDVRVFNSQGEAVPYLIKRMDVRSEGGPLQTLPLFPLPGEAQAGTQGVRVTVDSPDGAIKLQTDGRTAPNAPVTQYLVDARPLATAIAALLLSWPDSSADFSGRMRIECSDDLATWRMLVSAAPIANLRAGTQQLLENRIETPNIQAKFYRLTWVGHGPSFGLTEVRAQAAQGLPRVNWSTLVVTGKAGQATGDYDFDLGARFPLQRVNLILPDTNSVYLADFKSRARDKDPWREVWRAGVYRLAGADGQQLNGPIEVPLDRDRYWRVHLSGEGSANIALRLQGSWSPSEIEFVAHGAPPYLLAYGSSSVAGAATDLSVIPSGALISTATLGSRSALGGEGRIAAAGSPLDKRNVLWAVLVMAVAALATMAARLARGRSRSRQ